MNPENPATSSPIMITAMITVATIGSFSENLPTAVIPSAVAFASADDAVMSAFVSPSIINPNAITSATTTNATATPTKPQIAPDI